MALISEAELGGMTEHGDSQYECNRNNIPQQLWQCRGYANTFTGGAGSDRIESGSSADTYLFNRGDGRDVIRDHNNWGL
jgi:hypothetical protein